jgi:hypothetical protein
LVGGDHVEIGTVAALKTKPMRLRFATRHNPASPSASSRRPRCASERHVDATLKQCRPMEFNLADLKKLADIE